MSPLESLNRSVGRLQLILVGHIMTYQYRVVMKPSHLIQTDDLPVEVSQWHHINYALEGVTMHRWNDNTHKMLSYCHCTQISAAYCVFNLCVIRRA